MPARLGETDLVPRWYELTREVLPAMAAAQRWPISRDHCFMRVCLDAVLGSPWDVAVPRPAVRNMSEMQLAAAIRTAEAIVAEPDRLPALNARSLAGRRHSRADPPASSGTEGGRETRVHTPRR